MGAEPLSGETTRFRVWAPKARQMAVEIVATASAASWRWSGAADDVFEVVASNVAAGSDYFYVIDGDKERPDPCSRYQPNGVHGPSRVVGTDFAWSDCDWPGIDLGELVLYELHTGTFTPEGTFESDHSEARSLARSRHHRHRAHARRAVSGAAQLGLRRRLPLRRARELRRARGPATLGRREPRVEGSPC